MRASQKEVKISNLLTTFTNFHQKKRHVADKEVNHRKCTIFRDGIFKEVLWKEVVVGDICELRNLAEAPADMVVLTSSEKTGNFYVETSNLDGFVSQFFFLLQLQSFSSYSDGLLEYTIST